jgi:hypothetical protein
LRARTSWVREGGERPGLMVLCRRRRRRHRRRRALFLTLNCGATLQTAASRGLGLYALLLLPLPPADPLTDRAAMAAAKARPSGPPAVAAPGVL